MSDVKLKPKVPKGAPIVEINDEGQTVSIQQYEDGSSVMKRVFPGDYPDAKRPAPTPKRKAKEE